MSKRIVVVGAGVVGACCALELVNDGHSVTIVDPAEPGGEHAASFGNGAWISPASVVPMSLPGTWKRIPGFILDPSGPLAIRWADMPWLFNWLVCFLKAGSNIQNVEAASRSLAALIGDAPARHLAVARESGQAELIVAGDLLYVFPDRRAYEDEKLAWRLRRENGVRWSEVTPDELRRCEPHLSSAYSFAARVHGGAHCLDPGAYVAGIVRHAQAKGAELVRASAKSFEVRDGALRAVLIDGGSIACEYAVLSAGIHSAALARSVGDRTPLASERGYHVVIADPAVGPSRPIMPSDGKMANTMTRRGLRAAGQVELGRVASPPNWRRADILLDHLLATYPGLSRQVPPDKLSKWMGHRPSTPDGLPVIGTAPLCHNVILAYGHGHTGLAAAPKTARLAADLIAARVSPKALDSYRPNRW